MKIQIKHFELILFGVVVLLFLAIIFSMSLGRYSIKPIDVLKILLDPVLGMHQTWSDQAESIVFTLRLPRVLAAILIGSALSLSGAAYQSVFRNPLVAPDLLGVSAGACVGAAISIIFGFSDGITEVGAFIGGLAAVFIALSIPHIIGRSSVIMLVLAGIIVSGFMSSILGILKYVADTETQLPVITYWQMGSLVNVTWYNIAVSGLPIVLCLIFMMLIRWKMNILTLSEEEVHMLGNRISWLRYAIIFCATILTACSVCMSGTIGWIGLVIPHFSRILAGPDNQKLIPLTIFLGALFLLTIDTISRTLIDTEIPLSILTGLIGAPFYFYLLIKQRTVLQ